jgi:hypothetical protein
MFAFVKEHSNHREVTQKGSVGQLSLTHQHPDPLPFPYENRILLVGLSPHLAHDQAADTYECNINLKLSNL